MSIVVKTARKTTICNKAKRVCSYKLHLCISKIVKNQKK